MKVESFNENMLNSLMKKQVYVTFAKMFSTFFSPLRGTVATPCAVGQTKTCIHAWYQTNTIMGHIL